MKVLGIGELVLDKSCLLETYPAEGSKVAPIKVEYSMGGPVSSALILLAKLGCDCKLIASVGDDSDGERIKHKISKTGVRLIPHMQRHTKVNTYLVNSTNGSRTGIKTEVKHSAISNVSEQLVQDVDLILFDRHEEQAFHEVLKHKKPLTKVIVDPSTEVSPKTLRMLALVDYPIVPIEVLEKVRRHEDKLANLRELHSIVGKDIIVTAGDKGALLFDGKDIQIFPAAEITAVDALGAGDIFRGAFGYGILQKWEVTECIKYANAVSALQCLKIGNSSAIPNKIEIDNFLKVVRWKTVTQEEIFNC